VGDAPFALVMADHVFAPALMSRLRATSVQPGEVVVAVDRSLGRAAGVDPTDAMKVRLVGGPRRGHRQDAARLRRVRRGRLRLQRGRVRRGRGGRRVRRHCVRGAVQQLAGLGTARALPLDDGEWWFDVDTPTDYRRGSRYLFRSTGKALDGAVATRLNRASRNAP